MNIPQLTAAIAVPVLAYQYLKPHSSASLAKTVGSSSVCQEKYCPPSFLIHVDRAVNTLNRDDTRGGPTMAATYEYTKSVYAKEAAEHPGVQLVAHTVF